MTGRYAVRAGGFWTVLPISNPTGGSISTDLSLVVEPGGAVALAALLNGKLESPGATVAIILSGGNIAPELFCECLERHPSP